MKFFKAVSCFLVLFLYVTSNLWADTILIYPDITYQTITGWETMFGYDLELGTLTDEILDQVANDLGINRVRLEIRAGVENDTDDIWWILEGQDYRRLWWELDEEDYSVVATEN